VNQEQHEFASFYEQARDDCYRTIFAVTGDAGSAEDVTAEAFARAWASWRRVRRHPAPRAWVVRTALNANVSAWRRIRREIPLVNYHEPGAGQITGSGVDPALMAALQRLPERQRQVVALRIFLDLDSAATARVLGIAPGTVTAHLARAMKSLRAALDSSGLLDGSGLHDSSGLKETK
jgi:RNA polymerase sigma-70 factor (sigma-E family)